MNRRSFLHVTTSAFVACSLPPHGGCFWQGRVGAGLGRRVTFAIARLEEDITRGQSVARYTLYGAVDRDWRVLSHGSTIGYMKLDLFEPVTVRRVRLAIEDAAGMPQDIAVRLYNPSVWYSR